MVASLALVIEVQVVEDHIVGCAHLQLQVEGNVNVTQMACDVQWGATALVPLRDQLQCFTLGEVSLLLLEDVCDVGEAASVHVGEEPAGIHKQLLAQRNFNVNFVITRHC